jgi:4-oxalocrotonate tautomerase family enzyme
MPIITVQFIKDVVANDEQKRELIVKLTDTFISVVGEVARPYVYTIIQETPQMEWGIGGKPMPDLAFLIGPEYRGMHEKSNEIMGAVVEQAKAQASSSGGSQSEKDAVAAQMWLGGKEHE